MREAVPNIERVALIWDPTTGPDQLDAAKAAARAMRLEPFVLELRTSEGFEAAFRRPADLIPRTRVAFNLCNARGDIGRHPICAPSGS